jgi:hemoglobin
MPDVTLDETSLTRFLDAFYSRVRGDALIGPVFADAIPESEWPRHMARIHAFWSSVLLRSGRYTGNPFGKHRALARLEPEHFARWLGLFEETAAAHFPRDVSALLTERAHRIGESLQAGLFRGPDPAHA